MNHEHPTKIRDYTLRWTEWHDPDTHRYVCEVRLTPPRLPDIIITTTSEMEPAEARANAMSGVLDAVARLDRERGLTIMPVGPWEVVQPGDYFDDGDGWRIIANTTSWGAGAHTWLHITIGRPTITPPPTTVEVTLVYTP